MVVTHQSVFCTPPLIIYWRQLIYLCTPENQATIDKWPLSLQHVQDIVQASILVDPVTEADVGQSIVVTVMSAMPQVGAKRLCNILMISLH